MRRNSITERWASRAVFEVVKTFMPSMTGVAQAGSGFGARSNLHQAHPAVRGDGELLVVAEARDCDPGRVGGFDDHRPLARLAGAPVESRW